MSVSFDRRQTDLRVGVELEYPGLGDGDERFVDRGRSTNALNERVNRPPSSVGGNCVYDGTVGAEFVSDVIHVDDAPNWYRDVIDWVEDEHGVGHQPVGLMRGGSTAGLHIHLSPLTEEQARRLYEISQTPWAKVMFCSSIANDSDGPTWPVFRGGRHCRMEYGGSRYAVVNQRSPEHYEWRLPEPMAPEHLDVVADFLALFHEDADAAVQYAQERLDEGDDRITSIKRAEAVGMDIDEVPAIRREQYPEDPEHFYETVEESWHLPEIHRVDFRGESFYVFESEMSGPWEAEGVSFMADDVIHAPTLEQITDRELHEDVQRAFSRRGNEARRETEATTELKDIIKKKKGKL